MARITIGMLVYNDKNFISESIDCILSQSFSDFKLIIADDHSTDGSDLICKKYSEIDSRIQYIRHEKNIGISKNMKLLLSIAETEYFMWATDDDLWDKNFVSNLVNLLDKNPDAICAFSTFQLIDENKKPISGLLNFDYSDKFAFNRLEKLIENTNDTFGYGIFRTDKIKGVEFPVWWWPNTIDPYNNIHPSLCYYLSKGNFVNYNGEALFYNRIKPSEKVNHRQPFKPNTIMAFIAFGIRKFNLIVFSTKMIRKSSGTSLALGIYPILFQYWFLKPLYLHLKDYLAFHFKRK